jgi:TetR/AcrR family transcriptional repressor of nem operon
MSKEQILEIADRQMKDGGYDALNFREISEHLNISKANVHHHFKNKETLAIEVTDHYAQMHFQTFNEIGNQTAPDYIKFIKQINEMFWGMAKESNSCSVCVCSQVIKSDNVPAALLERAHSHFNTMNELFTKFAKIAIENKSINTKLSAKEVGLQTRIFMSGIMTVAQGFPDVASAKKVLGKQADLWLNNLK